jgi:hypothetical protein
MMGEVIETSFVTKLDVPAERVLQTAGQADLEIAVVVGWTADGNLYFASSAASAPQVLWLLGLAQKQLLEIGAA